MKVSMFALRWVLLAAAAVMAAWVTPDADFRGGPVSALVVAALIAAANLVAHLGLKLFSTPSNLLALAILTVVVNGSIVWLASAFTTRLRIDGFVAAITFTIMVSVYSVALGWLAAKVLVHRQRSVREPA